MGSMLEKKKFEQGTLDDEGTVGVLPGEDGLVPESAKSKFLSALGKMGDGMQSANKLEEGPAAPKPMDLSGFMQPQQEVPMQSKYMALRKLYGLE